MDIHLLHTLDVVMLNYFMLEYLFSLLTVNKYLHLNIDKY